jgi:uncharacterized protein
MGSWCAATKACPDPLRGLRPVSYGVELEDARAAGLALLPRCPLIAAYIRRHLEYADLVPPAERAHYLDR